MLSQALLGFVPFLTLLLTFGVIALAQRMHRGGGAEEPWLRAGWTVARRDVSRLLGRASSAFTRTHRGLTIELVSETPPASAAPFHEIMLGRFSTRWRTYLPVNLSSHRLCPFQLFERAALVKAPIFSLTSLGAVWFPRWRDPVPVGDPRLHARFDLYAEDPACAISLVAELAAPLLAAPHFGLLEIVGPELRVYVSIGAAGLLGDHPVRLAAHVDVLSDLLVEVAGTLCLEGSSASSGAMSRIRGAWDTAAENPLPADVLGMSNGRLNWVGWSALGLVVAFGFGGARAWQRFSDVPTPASKVPSAAGTESNSTRSQAPAASHSAATSAPQIGAAPTLTLAPAVAVAGSAAGAATARPAALCESVVDGLTILRPCTGAPGEVRSSRATSKLGKPQCVVSVDGLTILRDCQGAKAPRATPSARH